MNTNLNAVGNTIENAVRDTMDKAIAFTGPGAHSAARATIDAVTDILGFNMSMKTKDESVVYLIPDGRFTQNSLTLPERAIVAAFAEHFKSHTIGLERGKPVHFPKVVCSANSDKDDITEVGFASEARAYMFAEVVTHVFDLTADVIEAPSGERWMVAASSENGIDGDVLEQLRGACAIVEKYNVEYDADNADAAADDGNSAPLTRLESMVGQILSRLNQSPAMAAKTPPAARDAFDPSQDDDATPAKVDKHVIPGSGKPAKKRSA